jgi:hypothetical protein
MNTPHDESPLPTLPSGIYRHYKQRHYLVLGYGHDANYEDRWVVVYVGLELNDAHSGPRLAVRTVEDFLAWVTPEGTMVADQYQPESMQIKQGHMRRFTYIGPSWDPDQMPQPGSKL